ncbi:MAG: ABC transporter permease [Kofleriaceae bacterium]|nr:ABC transporter permease [Kofleriaceae bacterium]MCL4223278.1 ABC transporter permease [Myxococcales bacterium]
MLAATIQKDLQLLARDRGALISLFLLPVVFIAVFGAFFSDDGGGRRRVLMVWAADAPRPAAVVAALEASQLFELRPAASADEVRAAVAAERAHAGLILAADFDPAAGRPAELAIDEALAPPVRLPILGALTALVHRAVFPPPAGADRPVLVPRTPPGVQRVLRDVDAFQLSVPGNAVLFGFFLALTVGLAFAEERRWGTWRRLLAAPVGRWRLLVAKLVPYVLVGFVQFGFLFGLGIAVFGMRIGGSVVALVVLTAAVVLCAVALGLVFAATGGSEKRMGSIGSVSLLIMGMIGGAMVPRAIMPPALKAAGLLVPHGWALDGYFTLLVRDGAGLADIWPQLGAVLAFAAAFLALGVWRFRFER